MAVRAGEVLAPDDVNPYQEPPREGLLEAWYRPLGYALHLVTNSPEIAAIVERALSGYGPAAQPGSGEPDPGEAHFSFRFFEHGVDDGTLGHPVLREDGPLVYQTTGRDSTLVLDRDAGTAYGYFSRTAIAEPGFFRWHFLDLALFYMVEHRGFVGVHGAALARGGRALLLRAPSGHGKTTLAYAGARGRFQALAEDVVWTSPGNARWWGTPWAFHLLPDARDLFPELAGERPAEQIGGEVKIAVSMEGLWPRSTAASAEPAGVVLLRRAPGGVSRLEEVSVEEIPAEEARREWMTGCARRESDVAGYDRRVDEILTLPTWRLRFGDDIDRALDLLEPLFG